MKGKAGEEHAYSLYFAHSFLQGRAWPSSHKFQASGLSEPGLL